MTNENQGRNRLNEVDAEGYAQYPKEVWERQCGRVFERLNKGEIEQAEFVKELLKPTAAAWVFAKGMEAAPSEEWNSWRNEMPHRKARIERAR